MIMSAITRRAFQLLILTVVQAVVIFVGAGHLGWRAGWVYLALYVGLLALASVLLVPRRPEVVAERSRGSSGGRRWDFWITRVLAVASLGILAVSGLDERWQWSPPVAAPVRGGGVVLFILGYALLLWAMYANTFFSQVVRIQAERGHAVITTGPYAYVRHPGYVGMVTSALGTGFLLGSLWALLPWAVYVAAVIVRTALEDRTLQQELPGYTDYAEQTRYRLLPLVW
jgi:protein-S-isoprenylcysteine O-methyltransferase Ste14